MSDYLWDKTGEPEEDVAQLENLLGALKYRPRPLEIPATAMPAATTGTGSTLPTTKTIFSRPRLALAASLLLTLLAGAWLITRQGEPPRREQIAEIKQGSPAAVSAQPDEAIAPNAETDKHAPTAGGERPGSREDKASALVAAVSTPRSRRASRPPVERRHKLARRGVENAPAPREEVAATGRNAMRWQVEQPLTPRQREATEQLMLALRLASAKFNYAQREMLEIGRTGK